MPLTSSLASDPLRFLKRTPVRTFFLTPLITVCWELWLTNGRLQFQPPFLLLMLWGFLQYRLCGSYRTSRGGGGPGTDIPPERLVRTGLYAYTRNPMYLGHIIFLIGLSGTLKSLFATAITIATACWFHFRVLRDERRLAERFGQPYLDYMASVKRWIPGIF